jgi:hypothetical protein
MLGGCFVERPHAHATPQQTPPHLHRQIRTPSESACALCGVFFLQEEQALDGWWAQTAEDARCASLKHVVCSPTHQRAGQNNTERIDVYAKQRLSGCCCARVCVKGGAFAFVSKGLTNNNNNEGPLRLCRRRQPCIARARRFAAAASAAAAAREGGFDATECIVYCASKKAREKTGTKRQGSSK